ncbi:hypothetical protein GMORB2_0002 [Geosmithia morbida]|uniref:Uncharacterized protein n=1 Tax=Geosmithia morbida TaxID=1094350 RepID=A0A9P4Z2I0_9HYPO|nr:uncharacterized protein GMORB2_0002 [Geosmithia morbida]KAF4126266.1 hypothetical protein GMORB2_0002 [Geosmithia morbida]
MRSADTLVIIILARTLVQISGNSARNLTYEYEYTVGFSTAVTMTSTGTDCAGYMAVPSQYPSTRIFFGQRGTRRSVNYQVIGTDGGPPPGG